MLCTPSYPADASWYVGRYGTVSYRGSERFYACAAGPAAGLSSLTTQTSITVTPSAATVASEASALITPTPLAVRLQYILPHNLVDVLPLESQCEKISLQASRCQQGEPDASSAGLSSTTPTQSLLPNPSMYTGSAIALHSVSLSLSLILIVIVSIIFQLSA